MKHKLILIIRWIGILPIAIISNITAYWGIVLANRFWSDENSWAVLYFAPIMGALISSIVSIIAGTFTAPKYNHIVAFILLVIFLITGGVGIYIYLLKREYFEFIKILIGIIGSSIGYFIAKEKDLLEDITSNK